MASVRTKGHDDCRFGQQRYERRNPAKAGPTSGFTNNRRTVASAADGRVSAEPMPKSSCPDRSVWIS
ncbi:hypothetical protein [Pseudomonas sp. Q2-TVG4-2]|uniref:hypothetical protein n=1 Tax=Pseudomonas sp. Q2-TVG4-2 TaxID=1685699 RepID=UPI0015E741A2|nr:hypothetical protein [Pseudomonas sp. Q2-TVG4-2]